ncbi:MAG: phosphatidylcholine/phosphatidylserine synthase [Pseudomonadota bacterium]|nr:phosphatidylcholine/phosphatidylserine synthase [Pseudomonadota bacterium]MDE3038272.1 phosphatidylcholine/phosphatidylserine synthase [Pseudomonadota bacterium]
MSEFFREERKRRRRLLRGEQPISRLFPNMITLAGLCCGLSAVRFAMLGRWEIAVSFIIASALLDGMDGRVARMLGATSIFGAQLDSLSDFLCFGIAPPLVIYMWQLQSIHGLGWAVVLFFAVSAALRLARFNTALFDDNKEEWEKQFFVGVPSPAGGILCLLPLILSFNFQDFTPHAAATIGYLLVIGSLMPSRIPTFAGKHLRIRHEYIAPFMMGCSVLLVVFIIDPWGLLSLLSIAYLGSIFFSVRRWKTLKAASVSHGESS